MNATLQARSLWSLWLKEQHTSPQAQVFPFYARVQTLLNQQTLSPVLNALFAMVDQLNAVETLNDLVAATHRMAQWVQVEEEGTFHSLLVALPVQGQHAQHVPPEEVWVEVDQYLQHRFQQRLKARGQGPLGLAITVVPGWLTPEACATLDLDGVYRLTQELAQGQPGPLTQRLLDMNATLAPAATDDQRLTVAVITHNARQLRAHEALDHWLNELDPQDWVWRRQWAAGDAPGHPPMPFIEAMTVALLQRLETGMAARCQALGVNLDTATVTWTEMTEDDTTDTMRLIASVDGVPVPALVLPSNWFALTGPGAIGDVLSLWDYPVDVACEFEEPSSHEPTPSSVVPLRRRCPFDPTSPHP